MNRETLHTFRQSIPYFQALMDSHRQDILVLLSEHKTLSIKEIAQRMTLSRTAVIYHLQALEDVGLVKGQKEGREKRYVMQLQDAYQMLLRMTQQIGKEMSTVSNEKTANERHNEARNK